jgi:hypothetical protein
MLVALATKIHESKLAPVSAHDVAGYAAQLRSSSTASQSPRAPEDAHWTWNNFRLT